MVKNYHIFRYKFGLPMWKSLYENLPESCPIYLSESAPTNFGHISDKFSDKMSEKIFLRFCLDFGQNFEQIFGQNIFLFLFGFGQNFVQNIGRNLYKFKSGKIWKIACKTVTLNMQNAAKTYFWHKFNQNLKNQQSILEIVKISRNDGFFLSHLNLNERRFQ